MKPLLCSFIALRAFAADAPKPTPPDPIATIRADIAITQRDFVIANSESEAAKAKASEAQKRMMAKYDEASAACKGVGRIFDPNVIKCGDLIPATDKK